MCLDGERKDRLKADTPATLLLRFLWKHKRNNKGSSRCRILTFQIIYLFITCVGSYFVPHTSNLFWYRNVWLLMHFLNIGSVCHHKLLNLKQLTKPQSVGGVEQNYCMNFSAIIVFFFIHDLPFASTYLLVHHFVFIHYSINETSSDQQTSVHDHYHLTYASFSFSIRIAIHQI